MTTLKILQNQTHFSNPDYKSIATTVVHALEQHKYRIILRLLSRNEFGIGLVMYLICGHYDVIITIGHKAALIYGLMNRIYNRKYKMHVAKEFFFDDKYKRSICNYVKYSLYTFAFKSIDLLIVNSSPEVETYARLFEIPKSKIRFIAWPSNINNPTFIKSHEDFYLAVGRSLRDWQVLFDSVLTLDIQLRIVLSKADFLLYKYYIGKNISAYVDIDRSEYLSLLQKCKGVIIPLLDVSRSTGQACLLEAWAYGKPVIIADVAGTKDYVIDGTNSLVYQSGDEVSLKKAIISLENEFPLVERISKGGFNSITQNFNKRNYANSMSSIVSEFYLSKYYPSKELEKRFT